MGTKTDTRTRGLLSEFGHDFVLAREQLEFDRHSKRLATATYLEILDELEAVVQSSAFPLPADRRLFLRAVQPTAPYLRAFMLRTAEVLARDPAAKNAKSKSSRITRADAARGKAALLGLLFPSSGQGKWPTDANPDETALRNDYQFLHDGVTRLSLLYRDGSRPAFRSAIGVLYSKYRKETGREHQDAAATGRRVSTSHSRPARVAETLTADLYAVPVRVVRAILKHEPYKI